MLLAMVDTGHLG